MEEQQFDLPNEVRDFDAEAAMKVEALNAFLEGNLTEEETQFAMGVEFKEEIEPKQHLITYDPHGDQGHGVYCTCGGYKVHRRGKVLAKWVDRHHAKTGHLYKRT